jgi:hypothetical protein
MSKPTLRRAASRHAIACALALAAVGAVGGTAWAVESASADSGDTTIHACVSHVTGSVRVLDAGASCRHDETALSWNQTGPAGPQGPEGPAGPTGPAGPSGPAGPTTTVTATPTGAGKGDVAASGTLTVDQLGDRTNVVIPIDDESFAVSAAPAGGGAPRFSQLIVVKPADSFSGALFNAATTNTTLGNATITLPGSANSATVRIQLHGVRVVSFNTSSVDGSTREQLALTFDDIFYNGGHYRFPPTSSPSAASTSAPAPTPSGWDLATG